MPNDSGSRLEIVAVGADSRLAAFARDVRHGLTQTPKQLSCCYFYDGEGSQLFEEICDLPEYYLTAAERSIFERYATDLAARFDRPVELVELGSGNSAKTRLLIKAFLLRQGELRYVPVDICRTVLEDSAQSLLKDFEALNVLAIAAEYQEALRHLPRRPDQTRLVLWLGSNVGNFHRPDAAAFLRQIRATLAAGDRFLIGVDLRKDAAVLQRAYDDSRGVTADFNLNLLTRINRELGGRFDLELFRHHAVYDEQLGRIEMWLISKAAQRVPIDSLDVVLEFEKHEGIHTENSYKYSLGEIVTLARDSGFVIEEQWFDAEKRFSVSLLAPA